MSKITERLEKVQKRIKQAATEANRDPDDILLLAVSKTRPASDIEDAIKSGLSDFGENYLQEAVAKIEQLKQHPLTWHYIGRIQGNKTRPIAENFDWVHTLSSFKHARRLNEQRPGQLPELNVCIQVNISDEESKGGVTPDELPQLAKDIAQLPHLKLRGLMCLPQASNDPDEQQASFARLVELQQELKQTGLPLDTLSMGMSGDMEAAIAQGSTIVRIGTDIFGPRT